MASRYTQQFTLQDIFCNKALQDKVPYINYKEKDGKQATRTATVATLVFNTAINAATPYYKPIMPTRRRETLFIDGQSDSELSDVVDVVYGAILANRNMLTITANDAPLIRTALKENKNAKLYLRIGSMREIEQMGKRERNKLMQDVVRNIYYGADFEKTRKTHKLEKLDSKYELHREKWLKEIAQ